MKKGLFSQKFRVLIALFGFSDQQSVAGIHLIPKDEPPVVVVPPTK